MSAKKSIYSFSEPIQEFLREMFRFAGLEDKVEEVDFSNDWYDKYTWTSEQQEQFRKYLLERVKNKKDILRKLFIRNLSNKSIERAVDWLMLIYGLRVENK